MRLIVKISTLIEQGVVLLLLLLVFFYDAFTSTFGFLDELTALFSIIILFFTITVKGKVKFYSYEYKIALSLGVIVVSGLLSNFLAYRNGNYTEPMAIFGDFVNFFKCFVVYFALRLLSNRFDANNVLKKMSKYLEMIFYLLLFLVIIDFLFKIFPHPPRYGIYSFELFFQHGSRYSFAFAFIFLLLLPKYYKKKRLFLFFIIFIGLLSLRVKFFGFAFLAIIFVLYGKKLFKVPKVYFISIISAVALLMIWLFWDWLEMYFLFKSIDESWSRGVILYYSIIIGNDYFPLGTGFGTYSCYYSGLYYSWVYDMYKINNVYGISRFYWGFIADQYWPMVLAQFGYVGLLSMIYVMYNYFNLFMKKASTNPDFYSLCLSAILGLLLLLIDSTTDAILTQQRAVAIFAYLALIVNTTNEFNKK